MKKHLLKVMSSVFALLFVTSAWAELPTPVYQVNFEDLTLGDIGAGALGTAKGLAFTNNGTPGYNVAKVETTKGLYKKAIHRKSGAQIGYVALTDAEGVAIPMDGSSISFWTKSSGAADWQDFAGVDYVKASDSTKIYYSWERKGSATLNAVYASSSALEPAANNFTVDNDKLNHWVVVNNGGTQSYYVNGTFVESKDVSGTITMADYNYYVFGFGGCVTKNARWQNNCDVADLRVYGTALTAEQVAELYNEAITVTTEETALTTADINTLFAEHAMDILTVPANTTITFTDALTCEDLFIASEGDVTLTAETQPEATECAKLHFSKVAGTLKRSWLTTTSFGVNFHSDTSSDVSTALVETADWTQTEGASGSATVLDGASTVTWKSGGQYIENPNETMTSFIQGYLDDGAGVDITVTGIPYKNYDLYIYCESDTENTKLSYKTVNGVTYSVSSEGVTLSDSTEPWGDAGARGTTAAELGQNTMHIANLTASTLTINSIRSNGRGSISAIQVVNAEDRLNSIIHYEATISSGSETVTLSDLTGNVTWQDGKYNTIAINNEAEAATFHFDRDITAESFKVVSAAGCALTLTKADGVTLNIPSLHFGDAAGSVTLAFDPGTSEVFGGADLVVTTFNPEKIHVGEKITIQTAETLTTLPYRATANMDGTIVIASTVVNTDETNDNASIVNNKKYVITKGGDVSLGKLNLGNQGNTSQSITIDGGSMTITGTTDDPNNTQGTILLGHWTGSDRQLNVYNGSFTATVIGRLGWDGAAQVVVGKAGEGNTATMSLKGLRSGGSRNNPDSSLTVTENGTLTLGEGGINFTNANTPVVLSGGAIVYTATPVMTVAHAEGLQVTADSTVTIPDNTTLATPAVISGSGILTVNKAEGGNTSTLDLGTARPAGLVLGEGVKLALQLETDAEVVALNVTGLVAEDITVRNAAGEVIAAPGITVENGTLTVDSGMPILTAAGGTINFAETTNWTKAPETGKSFAINATADTTITLSEDAEYLDIFITGSGKVTFAGDYTLTADLVQVDVGAGLVVDNHIAAPLSILPDTWLPKSATNTGLYMSLDDFAAKALTANMGGNSINNGNTRVLARGVAPAKTETEGVTTALGVQFQYLDGTTLKTVVANFTQVDGQIVVTGVRAQYAENKSYLGNEVFGWTGGDAPAYATGATANGYGLCGITLQDAEAFVEEAKVNFETYDAALTTTRATPSKKITILEDLTLSGDRSMDMNLTVPAGVTLTAGSGDVIDYDDGGSLTLSGNLVLGDYRWTFDVDNTLTLYTGATITGNGDDYGGLDFCDGYITLTVNKVEGQDTVTIDTPVRARNAFGLALADGANVKFTGFKTTFSEITVTGTGSVTLEGAEDATYSPFKLASATTSVIHKSGTAPTVTAGLDGYVLATATAEGVTTYTLEQVAAKIGDAPYASLEAALTAAGEAATTITLMQDVASDITIADGQDITIVANGKTITGTVTVNGALSINTAITNIAGAGTLTYTSAYGDGDGNPGNLTVPAGMTVVFKSSSADGYVWPHGNGDSATIFLADGATLNLESGIAFVTIQNAEGATTGGEVVVTDTFTLGANNSGSIFTKVTVDTEKVLKFRAHNDTVVTINELILNGEIQAVTNDWTSNPVIQIPATGTLSGTGTIGANVALKFADGATLAGTPTVTGTATFEGGLTVKVDAVTTDAILTAGTITGTPTGTIYVADTLSTDYVLEVKDNALYIVEAVQPEVEVTTQEDLATALGTDGVTKITIKGNLSIAEALTLKDGQTLIIPAGVTVTATAGPLVVAGTIEVYGTLNGYALPYGNTGLVPSQGGLVKIGATGTVVMPKAWENSGLVPGTENLYVLSDCAEGAFLQIGDNEVWIKGTDAWTRQVAKIGTTYYATLAEAVAQGGDVTVLADCAGEGIFITQAVTIDFGGHTYTVTGPAVGSAGTTTQAFHIEALNQDVTLKNGTIIGDCYVENETADNKSVKMLVQNYSNLTLENMTLDATQGTNKIDATNPYVLSNNAGTTVIKGTTTIKAKDGGIAFDVCRYASYSSVSVTVESGTIIGKIEVSGTIGEGQSASLTLNGGDYTAATLDVQNTATVTKASSVTLAAPEGYQWNTETGVLEPIPPTESIQDKIDAATSGVIETGDAEVKEENGVITVGGETVTAPADKPYYSLAVTEGKLTLVLNDNAKPVIAATEKTETDESIPALEVTADGLKINVPSLESALKYQLMGTIFLDADKVDWQPVDEAVTGQASHTFTGGTTYKFFKIEVTDK